MLRWQVHSENTWVSVTLKRVHEGHTQFLVKSDLEFGQLFAVTNYSVSFDPALGHIPGQVDWFLGHCWPGMEFGPNGPFLGQIWPRCRLCFHCVICVCRHFVSPLFLKKYIAPMSKEKTKIKFCIALYGEWEYCFLCSYAHLFRIQSHILLLHTQTIELQKGG